MVRAKLYHIQEILECDRDDTYKIGALQYIFSFRENIDTFSYFFFPHAITKDIPKFHLDFYDMLFKDSDDAWAMPRGHGKTTIAGLVFNSFNILNKIEKYIVYMSMNHAKSIQMIEPLRMEFYQNEKIKYVYPNISIGKVKNELGRDREDCIDINGVRLEAVSFEKNIRGFKYGVIRPTLIIGDDIDDDSRVLNPTLRMKDEHKLNKQVIPSLDPDKGRFKMIGTRIHMESLLAKKISQYNGKIFQACDSDFNNILFPSLWTKDKLKERYDSIGSVAFQSEFMNNPVDNASNLIKKEWIESCYNPDLSLSDKPNNIESNCLGVDFAFSDRATADNSAFVSVIKQRKKYVISHCSWAKGLSLSEQMEIIQTLHKSNEFDYIGLEENSIKAVSKDVSQWDLPIILFWTAATDPADKLKPEMVFDTKRYTIGKTAMISRLGVLFENGLIEIPYKTDEDKEKAHRLRDECMSFALSDGRLVESGIHPDLPLALCFAIECQKHNNSELVFADPDLMNRIETMSKSGLSDEEIIESMTTLGYDPEDVKEVLEDLLDEEDE